MKKNMLFRYGLMAAFSCLSLNSYASDTQEEAVLSVQALTERYPTQVIARPGIMPTGIFGINLNGSRSSTKKWGLDAEAEFGIVKDLEGRVSYDGLEFADFKAKQSFKLGLKYNYFAMPHLSSSIDAKLPINMSGDIVKSLSFGLPTTGYNDVMAGGMLGDLFTLHLKPSIAFDVDFNVWYGYQVFGDLWAQVNSSFGKVAMKNPNNQATWETQGFWKVLPARLTMIYALNNYFDLSAHGGFDNVLDKASDNFFFGLGFTARGGSIFG